MAEGAASPLRRFQLDGVHDTGKEVGHGSYAVVKELEFRGLKCVGKKIHDILINLAMPQEQADMLERFAQECELLGGLRHPCIVQFLGVCFDKGSPLPVLVMEYLHTTLSTCLERYGVLPKEISYGILRDVALGLRYLHEHSPPIIHRDLSANNVLLTSNMNAKISDLGVAKILNLTPARMTQMTQTKAPGTPCYMPPEALTAKPKYTSKIDIYSYGVLILHTLCGRWPFPEDVFRPDPQNPDAMIPISEVERRAEYLQEIGNDHPLMGLIHRCLSNVPTRRPEAPVLLERVNAILSTLPQPFTNQIEMIQHFKTYIQTLMDTKQSEIESLRAEVERLLVQSPSLQVHSQPSHFDTQSQARLQWKRCTDMPVKMSSAQAVVMGEKVYVGGGATENSEDFYRVFQYTTSKDEWNRLPPHTVCYFAMGQFAGSLITVGGSEGGSETTGKVYRFKEQSQQWEDFLNPMPTARYWLSAATTQSSIVASGGITTRGGKPVPCATVEVYSSKSSQWYTADPLPLSCYLTPSITIDNTFYLLGGTGADNKHTTTVLYASLTALLQRASPSLYTPVWKTLPDTPLKCSIAASLSGNLLAVGGGDNETPGSSAVHIFIPLENSWVRVVSGDLAEPRYECTAVQLSSNTMMVIGGRDDQHNFTKTVFLGSATARHRLYT